MRPTDSPTDIADPDPGGLWLTKAQLATAGGISVPWADRIGWRRQAGNDGRERVLVSRAWLDRRRPCPTDNQPNRPTDSPGDIARVAVASDAALAVLRDQIAHERDRADAGRLAAAKLAAAVAQIAQLTAQLAQLTAQAEAEALRQAEAARSVTPKPPGRFGGVLSGE